MPQVSRVMMPELWNSSDIPYDRYPKQNIKFTSIIGVSVRNLSDLNTTELKMPMTNPIMIEKNASFKKLRSIKNGVLDVNSEAGPVCSMTVLNSIIHTASFVIPSPKTILKSFGCSSYLIQATAATTSVQQSKEHMRRISITDKSNFSYSPISGLYFSSSPIIPLFKIQYVSIENRVNYATVPRRPNIRILVKFSKNFFLFIL
jgi:hypothetical protein